MQLTITGRHGRVSGAMRMHARECAERLADHFAPMTRMQITLDTDANEFVVEIIASLRRGAPLVAHARHEDMHAAIDVSFDKLSQQLRRLKDRVKRHRVTPLSEAVSEEGAASPAADEEPQP